MSKFIDKLKQASTAGGQPMGFRAAAAKPKPGMLLVAQVNTAGAATGADAGLLEIAKLSGIKALERASKAAPEIPWGGWLKEATGEGIGRLVAAGADFAVFPAGIPLFEEEKLGKILGVEPSLEPGLIKAIDELPIDAVLITAEDEPLTWHQLMLYQRCASLLSKPLLVSVPPGVSSNELGALREVGVMGVIVKSGAKGKIAEIRQMLDKLPPPSAGKRKAEPLLPRVGGETRIKSEEEED